MKNIAVSIEDDVYRRARMAAAARGTSVSALVKYYLIALAAGESEFERQERALRDRINAFRASNRLSREDIHSRGA